MRSLLIVVVAAVALVMAMQATAGPGADPRATVLWPGDVLREKCEPRDSEFIVNDGGAVIDAFQGEALQPVRSLGNTRVFADPRRTIRVALRVSHDGRRLAARSANGSVHPVYLLRLCI